MIVPDASVWVSHLIPQEAHHAHSRRWLTGLVESGTVIAAPSLLLTEVAGAIARRTGDSDIANKVVDHILTTPNLRLVTIDRTMGMLAARLAAQQFLRGADAMYVALAYRLQIPLVSWDQEQLDRASELVTTYVPSTNG